MALPPGKTIKEVYGKDVDVNAPLKVSPLVKAQVDKMDAELAKGESASSVPSRVSERSTKGKPATKLGDEGGRRRRTRRRARKHKKTRRHGRKH